MRASALGLKCRRERRSSGGPLRGRALGPPSAKRSRHFALCTAHAAQPAPAGVPSSGCASWPAWARDIARRGAATAVVGRRDAPGSAAALPVAPLVARSLRAAASCGRQQRLHQLAGLGARTVDDRGGGVPAVRHRAHGSSGSAARRARKSVAAPPARPMPTTALATDPGDSRVR